MNKKLDNKSYGYHIDETIKFLGRFAKVEVVDSKIRNGFRSVLVNINGFTIWIQERYTRAYLDVSHEIGCDDSDSAVMQFRWSEA